LPDLDGLLLVELMREDGSPFDTITTRVVWVAPAGGGWLAGCAFVREPSAAELSLLQATLARPSVADARGFARFPATVETVSETCTAMPGERRPARVLEVSAGGLALLLRCSFGGGTLLRLHLSEKVEAPECELIVRVVRVRARGRHYWRHDCDFVCRVDDKALRPLFVT
jgi:hypothetical protein